MKFTAAGMTKLVFNNISQSLAEQLGITDADIQERKDLLGLTKEDEEQLGALREAAFRFSQTIVEEFYVHQTSVPQIRTLIGDSETLQRLQDSMRDYVLSLFQGEYAAEYVNSRLRIGKVHARIGVPPKLYVSSLQVLESMLCEHLRELDPEHAPVESLRRLMMFDLQFVFDTYIQGLVSEVALARNELLEYSRSLEKKIAERTERIEKLAWLDDLTGIKNRRAFFAAAAQELKSAKRRKGRLSLIFADLNGFKHINDSRGHAEGDRVLQRFAELLRRVCGGEDRCFRYGGDEFCILLPGAGTTDVREFCDQLREDLEQEFEGDLSVSIGVASASPKSYPDVDAFVAFADAGMYQDKQAAQQGGTSKAKAGK